MEKSILWTSLLSLSGLERKHFRQWLDSPFFCRKESLAHLYAYLCECLEHRRNPQQEMAMSRCDVTDITSFRLIMSELQGQLEAFLVYQTGLSEHFQIRLAGAWRRKGLEKQFGRALDQATKTLNKQPRRHRGYYEAMAEIAYERYQFSSSGQRTGELNLQELLDTTEVAFILAKLRQSCFALSHQAVYKIQYDFGLLDAVLNQIRSSSGLSANPAISLYYHCYLFLTAPETEQYFDEFQNLLILHRELLPPDEQRDLFLLAINYCIRKINQQKSGYFKQAFGLYKSALEAELLLENGQLSPFAFNNIVAIALKVGETEWAGQFINDYAPFLESRHREASVRLNLARVAYLKKDYRAAMLNLQEADYKDLINNLIAKTLLLKIYYETDEFDALDAHLQSMQRFISRQRVIGYHRDNYLNIIRFTRKLTQLKWSDAAEIMSFRSHIDSAAPLTEKDWFFEMIRQGRGEI
ncbi:MAG: hypothetical protein ACKOZV_08380 [Bacteroidota bacterium]